MICLNEINSFERIVRSMNELCIIYFRSVCMLNVSIHMAMRWQYIILFHTVNETTTTNVSFEIHSLSTLFTNIWQVQYIINYKYGKLLLILCDSFHYVSALRSVDSR